LPCQIKPWELIALAGEGTWARVYRARPAGGNLELAAAYAVKVLRPECENDPRAIAMLHREAAVGRSVAHAHVISILSASVIGPPYYLVMPWLNGTTLKAKLADGPLKLHVALWIARQTADALDALHKAGWVHGDTKPANIFVAREGHVTLLDLGFARRTSGIDSLADRCLLGTLAYLAPEGIAAPLTADIRADIYSLGVVLYEMLTGRAPFVAANLAGIAEEHRQKPISYLGQVAPDVPAEVVVLVHQMLANDPLRRPQTPAELVDRLAALELDAFANFITSW
jgi:serine/threonine-protein kinase